VTLRCWIVVWVLASACTGKIGNSSAGATPGAPPIIGGGVGGGVGRGPGHANPGPAAPPPGDDGLVFASATRRLTRSELRQTLLDLLGQDLAGELAKFPEDYSEANDVFAFDNKYTLQQPSAALVEAARNLGAVAAAGLLADPAAIARLVPCVPSAPGDTGCLRAFVAAFGRRALRRPLDAAELDGYVTALAPFAVEAKDFNQAVGLAVRALLQDPEFLYRVEIGQPVAGKPGLLQLGGYEVASRLSYFLWGTAPDDALLDAAGAGDRLQTPASIKAAATRLLADPRARRAVEKFHSMWLGYARQPPPAPLQASMLAETTALIDRVVFEQRRPWLDLFRSDETYLDGALAAHYGLPAPAGGSGWVPYTGSGRRGILSHGSFLGVDRKHQDTSPTLRGQLVRTRLMCQSIPPPPASLMVDADNPPTDGNCKSDRYNMWTREGCKTCHQRMDPIGHGLENYDQTGAFRTVAPDDQGKPACQISGAGMLMDASDPSFQGAAGLADRLVESKVLESCVTAQLAGFYLGREVRAPEQALFDRVAARFAAGGLRFDQMLLDLVTLPGFGYRQAE
jgi:hypothetical protein